MLNASIEKKRGEIEMMKDVEEILQSVEDGLAYFNEAEATGVLEKRTDIKEAEMVMEKYLERAGTCQSTFGLPNFAAENSGIRDLWEKSTKYPDFLPEEEMAIIFLAKEGREQAKEILLGLSFRHLIRFAYLQAYEKPRLYQRAFFEDLFIFLWDAVIDAIPSGLFMFRAEAKFTSYLGTILRNTFVDYSAKSEIIHEESDSIIANSTVPPSAETEAIASQICFFLKQAIGKFSERNQAILLMHLDDYTDWRIAKKLNYKTAEAVRSARRRLLDDFLQTSEALKVKELLECNRLNGYLARELHKTFTIFQQKSG